MKKHTYLIDVFCKKAEHKSLEENENILINTPLWQSCGYKSVKEHVKLTKRLTHSQK